MFLNSRQGDFGILSFPLQIHYNEGHSGCSVRYTPGRDVATAGLLARSSGILRTK